MRCHLREKDVHFLESSLLIVVLINSCCLPPSEMQAVDPDAPFSVPGGSATSSPANMGKDFPTHCSNDSQVLPGASSEGSSLETQITYLGHSGFMISSEETKVFVDALAVDFMMEHDLTAEITSDILSARVPFDGADLILATHEHADHFSAYSTQAYMNNDRDALFVSSPEAVEEILALDASLASRLMPVHLRPHECKRLRIRGIDLFVFHLSHGPFLPEVVNLGFVFNINGTTFFFSGDMNPADVSASTLQLYGLPDLGIDYAILPPRVLMDEHYRDRLNVGIQAVHLIPKNLVETSLAIELEDALPGVVLFHNVLETRIVQ